MKTKLLVEGHGVEESDKAPIVLQQGMINTVEDFTYLGSIDSSDIYIELLMLR